MWSVFQLHFYTQRPSPLTTAGLPDGMRIFKPKIQIWIILESLAMEDADIFY
jgi:hypothetical protein